MKGVGCEKFGARTWGNGILVFPPASDAENATQLMYSFEILLAGQMRTRGPRRMLIFRHEYIHIYMHARVCARPSALASPWRKKNESRDRYDGN